MLAVIVQHREIQRVNSLEILGIEHMLGADPMNRLGTEIGLKHTQDRAQDRHTGQSELTAFFLEGSMRSSSSRGKEPVRAIQ